MICLPKGIDAEVAGTILTPLAYYTLEHPLNPGDTSDLGELVDGSAIKERFWERSNKAISWRPSKSKRVCRRHWKRYACGFSRCSVLAEKDGKLTLEKRKELAKHYADDAMKHLQAAVKNGYKDTAHMKVDTNLDPLRRREDFKKLLADLEGK